MPATAERLGTVFVRRIAAARRVTSITVHAPWAEAHGAPFRRTMAGSNRLKGAGSVGAVILEASMRALLGLVLIALAASGCASDRPSAPTLTFTAAPSSVEAGQAATFTWEAKNVTSCTATDGAQTRAAPLAGSVPYAPTATGTYTMSCTGTFGSVQRSVAVAVVDAPRQTIIEWEHPPGFPVSSIAETRVEWSSSASFATVSGTLTVPAPATTATMSGPPPGTTHCYRLRTVSTGGQVSDPSSVGCKTAR